VSRRQVDVTTDFPTSRNRALDDAPTGANLAESPMQEVARSQEARPSGFSSTR